jgi:YD repeat-containing protein
VQVTEPNPAGGANLETYYTYTVLGQLAQVSMPRTGVTQTRAFTWSGRDLMNITNPESGTVSFTYDTYGRVVEARHCTIYGEDQDQRWNYSLLGCSLAQRGIGGPGLRALGGADAAC